MKNRVKIFNDPVYGFVGVPYGLLLELVDHPWFQRLRRIRQTGMAQLVYPGALHTRFHHALGALHLMRQAVEVLREKGIEISPEEAEAVAAAILLHDIGHGPYSHALEHTLLEHSHEEQSLIFMQALNKEFGGRLNMAIEIFTDLYPKRFLHQLVSGQLDMDRLDYLNRDSFYTGVSEGVIGYDRIIKMLTVHNGLLVVEEKGMYSIENFLIARRLMYWQVYLHKTSVAAEHMLVKLLGRAKDLAVKGESLFATPALAYFLSPKTAVEKSEPSAIEAFAALDDSDINIAIKEWAKHPDKILSTLAIGLHERRLFRVHWVKKSEMSAMRQQLLHSPRVPYYDFPNWQELLLEGEVSNRAYNPEKEQILILFKNGKVDPIEKCSDVLLFSKKVTKYFFCHPKNLLLKDIKAEGHTAD